MSKVMILPIGAGVIGQDDVPLVRIMDSDETPTTITVYGVVDTVQPVTAVTWTVNGVEQTGDVSRSPVLELTDLQPETSYSITLRATNINGESSASARTIMTKKVTTVTPNAVLDGVSYYNLDVYYTGNIPTKDENDIVVNGRDVTVPTGYYAESETVSVSSEYIIPTGTKNITDNGNEDVTQYANVNVNVQPALYTPSNVTPTTSQQTISTPTGYYGLDSVTVDGVTSAIDANIQAGNIKDGVTILGVTGTFDPTPNLDTLNVTPSTSSQTLSPTGGIDGWDEVNVGPVGASIDQNITAGNIKKDVTILGVTGTYDPQPNMTAINVVPTKQSQVITPTGGVDGFDEVNVYPVTSLIDSNITPENIKKDVSILGVTGTFEGGIQPTGTLNIVNNGTYDITNYANVNVNVAAGDFNELCFTANEANCTVRMTHNGTNQSTTKPLMFYSTDNKTTWTEWDYSVIILANIGDKVYFYGYNPNGFSSSSSNYSKFTTSGSVACSGNIMTLISRYGDRETIPSGYCFFHLFDSTTITTAPALPATTLTDSSYSYMFKDCGSLITAPELPATTLARYCYYQMFDSCRNITTAQALPATTLEDSCYSYMFYSCTSLTTPPALPATTLAGSCYSHMFERCTSLVTAPVLPATTLFDYSYSDMFYGCTSLVTAPALPATTLAFNCYSSMFYGCTSLTTAPALPATTLADSCYPFMFQGCTSLTTAPALPATTLVGSCYTGMFSGCTSLNSITINTESWDTSWTSNWVNNVSGSGTFVKPYALQTGTGTGQIPLNATNGIPTGWTIYESPSVTADDSEYITLGVPSGYGIYYTIDGSTPTTSSTLYTEPISVEGLGDTFTLKFISTDNNTFVSPVCEYTYYNMFYIEALENNTVLNLTNWKPRYSWYPVKVQYSTNKLAWANVDSGMSSYTLANTGDKVYFRRATAATSTDTGNVWGQGNLNDVTSGTIKVGGSLEYACYWDITGNRPASAGCESMFQNCTGLVDAYNLKLFGAWYPQFFRNCTNLTTAPKRLENVYDNGYQFMFQDCTSLITPPELPATTLAIACYQGMFYGCTSLATAPTLPATTLETVCYNGMFQNCTSLTTAPNLPATTVSERAYLYMFSGCTNLETAPATLPATTIEVGAYSYMFNGCSKLTNAPVMYFDNESYNGSYVDWIQGMFNGCTLIDRIEIHTKTWVRPSQATDWVNGVAATGTFIKPAELVIGTGIGQIPADSTSGIPTGWTVVTPQVATPSISYSDDTYGDGCPNTNGYGLLNISSDTADATIYYREAPYDCDGIDEIEPDLSNEAWTVYEGEISENYQPACDGTTPASFFVQAYASKSGMTDSEIAEYTYSVADDMGDCVEPDYCQECYDACEGDPDCEAACNECDMPCGEPCVDCNDCNNWSDCGYGSYEDCDCQVNGNCVTDCSDWENMGYESYEDCDCSENGNCPEEEEPVEEEPEP